VSDIKAILFQDLPFRTGDSRGAPPPLISLSPDTEAEKSGYNTIRKAGKFAVVR